MINNKLLTTPTEVNVMGERSSTLNLSGVGSNRVLQGPPIQVVGVALITEFYDHNYSFVEVVFQ